MIATQNPVETSGTFPLPEAQLDRFMMKLSMGLPSKEEECQILERYMKDEPLAVLQPILSLEELKQASDQAAEVLNVPIYGGDCVVLPSGKVKIIDFNEDWYIFGGISPLSTTTIGRKKDIYCKKNNVKKCIISRNKKEIRHFPLIILVKGEKDNLHYIYYERRNYL